VARTIQNIASMQLDLPDSNWDVVTFDGAWGRERNVTKRHLENGAIVIDSKNGTSSSYHSSCVYLQRPNCSPLFGEVFAFNLIYSGNHREVIEKSPYGTTRYLTGINPETFSWALKEGETFSTPEAIMTYSFVGTNKVSNNFHKFVNNHITRGYWKFKERPISVSNGNTSGLDFSESKLVSIAKAGRNLGAELFILEDGWFGRRDNDNSSLGDWFVNAKKIPNGITNLSDKIHRTGMLFGLWVEPEMISQNSMLYEKYPDWAVKIPGRDPSIGKNQFILDLTRDDVRRHIIDIMAEAFALGKVDYVRWDMNRVFSDIYSVSLSNMGEFCHRYVLGLYEILNALVREFPKILFEGATSCGNRFDLGLLCFMSQCTASSDSDILSMVKSQEGTSYGYPLAVMGNTIGPSFNPITLRHVSIESAFNVGAFGSLSYNVDFSELNSKERDIIENQIAYYKIHRPLLQYGKFCRICDETSDNRTLWIVSSKDYSEMIVLDFQYLTPMNGNQQVLRIPFANPNSAYLVTARGCEEEHFYVTGDVLSYSGIKLGPQDGTVSGGTRAIGDFGSRLYYISEVDKATIK
ncbi:MAG: alpha-galactosidase, partial [Sphaerochaetaceae bacterium]|nr:alpha-galactosidase [Sphaerochaetaceae bacterium]